MNKQKKERKKERKEKRKGDGKTKRKNALEENKERISWNEKVIDKKRLQSDAEKVKNWSIMREREREREQLISWVYLGY